MDNPTEPNSRSFEYTVLTTNNSDGDGDEATDNTPTVVSYEFACCVCRNINNTTFVVDGSTNSTTLEVTDELLNSCNDGNSEVPQSKIHIVIKNDSYLNGSFRILMMGGVNNVYNLNNNCSHYKLH